VTTRSAKLISLNAGPRAPSDLADKLRALADEVDRGHITDFVSVSVENGRYSFLYGASLAESLIMANLLLCECQDRMRK